MRITQVCFILTIDFKVNIFQYETQDKTQILDFQVVAVGQKRMKTIKIINLNPAPVSLLFFSISL